ncbi:hypothetical protein CALCODRAFT_1689 [Calocera cornea HHB12733]|uniref:Nucleoporin NSP1-like C-terminal domain-containing protein n=1 Tax=Calocera cornea HHB12733 TaxID=1353952 RepID=A0A165K821_9BASI|nr:hypothetical protein CALCODRAFT_1689 [Calocera cornea HHB12733]
MSDVNDAERTQLLVDSSLEHVETQQKELSAALDGYESLLSSMFEKNLGSSPYKTLTSSGLDAGTGGVRDLRPADKARQDAYALAERLNRELDDMSRNLAQMIDTLNALSAAGAGGAGAGAGLSAASLSFSSSGLNPASIAAAEDPVSQIVAILNSNLGTLQWIESKTRALEDKVRQTELMVAGTAAQSAGGDGPVVASAVPAQLAQSERRTTPRRTPTRSRLGMSSNTSW